MKLKMVATMAPTPVGDMYFLGRRQSTPIKYETDKILRPSHLEDDNLSGKKPVELVVIDELAMLDRIAEKTCEQ